uniref:U exon n=1 Tax=Cardioderma bat adenovirus TaxID=3141913 RepID=A0AAU7E1H1_9ADEN
MELVYNNRRVRLRGLMFKDFRKLAYRLGIKYDSWEEGRFVHAHGPRKYARVFASKK